MIFKVLAMAVAVKASAIEAPLPVDAGVVREAALRIDRHVAGWYRQQGLEVPQTTDDATFLRRAFLVTVGRIPTAEEALFFLEIDDADKRAQLIDYLIGSPGYTSHLGNWAFDLLRVADDKPGFQGNFQPYRAWVRRSLEANVPWDDLTRHLLAASGSAWDPHQAAVGYYLRDRGMPLDNLANSMRIFLGSRMECAQCHDDPFGETERRDFFELAAFTHGQHDGPRHLMGDLWDEVSRDERRESLDYSVAQVLWDEIYGMTLRGGGDGRIQLPGDYQYRDGDPGEWIAARTPFGDSVRMSNRRDADDGRQKLAAWVTTKTGDQFASVIANRLWERVMGRGVYEPVDEYIEADETHLPALMHELIALMREVDYDLRTFQKVLLNTRTFQFVPNPEPSKVATGDDFHGRQLARLSAEQVWDSLLTLAVGDPDKKAARSLDDRIMVQGRPVLVGKKTMADLSREVLALESEAQVRRYFDAFLAEVKAEWKGGGNAGAMAMMSAAPVSYGADAMVRASELPSPAPRDHLLALFGQADREVIGSASQEANVSQVLALMNGFVQRELVNSPEAHLYQSLNGTDDLTEKVRRLYIAILSRPPTDEEMDWMFDALNLAGEEAGLRTIVSALVMSSEFLFLQ